MQRLLFCATCMACFGRLPARESCLKCIDLHGMHAILKRVLSFVAIVLAVHTVRCQKMAPDAVRPGQTNDTSLLLYAWHKELPPGYEKEVLQALTHFPELKHITVKFRVKKSLSTLKTRPTFLSVFMPRGHRTYIIIISNQTTERLTPVMFANLGTDARIGIAGHELSHVADLSSKTTWQCLKIGIGHLSARYLDRFEFHTDLICIQHGLGKYLEAWSSYIRQTMHTVNWRGAGYANKPDMGYERYMNPSTIESYLLQMHNDSLRAK